MSLDHLADLQVDSQVFHAPSGAAQALLRSISLQWPDGKETAPRVNFHNERLGEIDKVTDKLIEEIER